ATGTVSGNVFVGGLVGINEIDSTISNSYATGTVSGNWYVGGLVGLNEGTISNSFYDNQANTASMNDSSLGRTKAEILTALTGKDGWITNGSDAEGYGTDTISLPKLKTFYKPTNTLFQSGYGTSTNPYTIKNWTQLQNINNSNILTKNYHFNLLNNLSSSTNDYTNLASNTANGGLGWNSIGWNYTNHFKGTFDGLGYTISNLNIDKSGADYQGLFGFTSGATIKNIGLENVNITGNSRVGVLVGYNHNSTISNS
ncbi:GLUG motif-containing protein, partial [Aliarcobacter cryaerophilus]|uniref:GLUG motif-containing protein n=1 Tax=Aliarcobacter cryaerophilus TaxID=28198 RepID=UPI000A54E3A3